MNISRTIALAGVPNTSPALYHRTGFLAPDSAALIEHTDESGQVSTTLFVRDIEMDRAKKLKRTNRVVKASDFEPEDGLSGDRETAMAQAVAEYLTQKEIKEVFVDRSFPYIFAHHMKAAGIFVEYDEELGVLERRSKRPHEIDALRKAQTITQQAMFMACRTIGRAESGVGGVLHHENEPLTSERVRRMITSFMIERGFSTPSDSIVVSLPHVVDCHHFGTGPLKTGLPVIVDIFPRDEESRYWGDCTRTVVHGAPSETLARMHAAVVAAKQTGIDALKPGATGHDVHQAVLATIAEFGFGYRPGSSDLDDPSPAMRHGTGHGIGLDVHEPILLSEGGAEVLSGEVFTVEPGLYSSKFGGVRVEDMVHVTENGPEILSGFYEGLKWS